MLINPAAVDRINLQKFEGEHANFHTGERFTFTPEHTAQLRAQLAPPTPARYWLLTATDAQHAPSGVLRDWLRAQGEGASAPPADARTMRA